MADHEIVDTASGKIRGIAIDGIKVFKGIPYGAPVEGAQRFAPPLKPAAWAGVRDAFEYGPSAMQDDDAFGLAPEIMALIPLRDAVPMGENCLVLNVWTPAVNDGRKRPVMFWCHGGAFISGSGSSPWYDGRKLSKKGDVVVVSINHRLGALGYLYLEELGGHEFDSSGNAGMLDIVAALEWVRDNIAAFGGDPANVTIFGESGGGAKVSVLMAMPAARGLFHKAIIQSGPAVEMMSRADATATARDILTELGLDASKVGELRRVSADQLLKAQIAVLKKNGLMSFANRRRSGFNPVIDGKNLPAGPFEPVAPEIASQVPLMIGTNKDEMTLFFGLAPWIDGMDAATLRERVRVFVGAERCDAILERYQRARPKDSTRDLMLAIATDLGVRIPSLQMAERKAAQ
ncbi:MAG TPA: carboxylesterase family protein, partial [Candidatus Binataceae bacterium]|nr:carboxylesterase family protein [Candidatus Binataceae bacterium]